MNKNFPIETRYSTLKRYQENYENDLKLSLESYEDNTEIDFLEVDLFSHKNRLENLLTTDPDYFNVRIDEGTINQRNINSQKRIISFIENKISAINNKELEATNSIFPTTGNSLNWQGTELQFAELTKALR